MADFAASLRLGSRLNFQRGGSLADYMHVETVSAVKPGIRRSMQGNRGRDTNPELLVRRALHRKGLRYRVDVQPIPGLRRRADIVFGPTKIAIFIDGCFWHRCPEHATDPATNVEYWRRKFARNVECDRETNGELEARGWLVIRVWEHEDPEAVALRVEGAVRSRREAARTPSAGVATPPTPRTSS